MLKIVKNEEGKRSVIRVATPTPIGTRVPAIGCGTCDDMIKVQKALTWQSHGPAAERVKQRFSELRKKA